MANDNKDDIIIAMLEEQKSLLKNTKSTQIDLTKVDNLVERMEKEISFTTKLTEQLAETMQAKLPPNASLSLKTFLKSIGITPKYVR